MRQVRLRLAIALLNRAVSDGGQASCRRKAGDSVQPSPARLKQERTYSMPHAVVADACMVISPGLIGVVGAASEALLAKNIGVGDGAEAFT